MWSRPLGDIITDLRGRSLAPASLVVDALSEVDRRLAALEAGRRAHVMAAIDLARKMPHASYEEIAAEAARVGVAVVDDGGHDDAR